MNWSRWYAAKSYLRSALWTAPLFALVLEQIAIRLTSAIDAAFPGLTHATTTAGGAAAVTEVVITVTASFVVFTFGSMLVAIQVASGQLTPRIIATTLLRDNVIRMSVGLFIFSFLFAAGTRARIEATTPGLAVSITVFLGFASVTTFLFLIDYTARLLRPITIVWRIGELGIRVIETVYPDPIDGTRIVSRQHQSLGSPSRIVEKRASSAIVLAANLPELVRLARTSGGVIEFVPRVGDFVALGEPLFRLYGGATAIDDDRLRAQVAFGPERTIEQDSTFAFRVIVDVGIKALSKAINDPTTAVLAIDQLHRLLRLVGNRHLHDDRLFDVEGALRLVFPTPDWVDFVQLSFSELRLYGPDNFQVARRLRAMIDNLLSTLPESRRPALRLELDLLDRAIERSHVDPENIARARQSDLQGLGGAGRGAVDQSGGRASVADGGSPNAIR
jgi:uncharacterized membrane protein